MFYGNFWRLNWLFNECKNVAFSNSVRLARCQKTCVARHNKSFFNCFWSFLRKGILGIIIQIAFSYMIASAGDLIDCVICLIKS